MAKGGGKSSRNASSGQFVTQRYANSHKSTTVTETRGGGSTGGTHRSAGTGKFVTDCYAKAHPSTTIKHS